MITAVLFGAGRMAEAFAEQAASYQGVMIQALVARQAPPWIADTPCYPQLDDLPAAPQLLVDFTLPQGTTEAANWCAARKVALLSGVTGLGSGQFQAMQQAAKTVAVMWSPNLSLGVNLVARLARQASAALPAETRVHIHDVHHQHKKDAPSGTALMLGGAITAANSARQMEYSSRREGEVIGEHRITFSWAGEEITLTHAAKDRAVFARGALSAAGWLAQQPAGFYTAEDWLAGLGQIADGDLAK
jgi:4-hydroxy-tetrahydrodipicolinate reductase